LEQAPGRSTNHSNSPGKAEISKATVARPLLTISLFHFVNDAAVVTLPIIYPLLYDQGFIITRYSYIGILFLSGLGVTILTQFLIGTFVREENFRKVLPIAIMGLGLMLALITRTDRFLTFLLFFLLIRTTTSFYHPVGIAWINSLFRGKNLDRSMGIQSAIGDLGVFVSFLIGGILAELTGWRTPLITWAIVAMAVAMFGFFMSMSAQKISANTELEPTAIRQSWREGYESTKSLVPAFLLGGITWMIVLSYAPSLFHHRMSVSMSSTGYILASWIGAGTVASLLYGRIVLYTGHRLMLILSYTVVLLSSVVLWRTNDTTLAVVVMIIFGFFLFLSYPCLLSCVGKKIQDVSGPSAFSIVANLQITGGAVFSFVGGFLSDAYGIDSPFKLLAAAAMVVLVYLLIKGRSIFE
jgi:MFS family permease